MKMLLRYLLMAAMVLATPALYGQQGVVSVSSNVVIIPESGSGSDLVRGYSVRIFSDNSQSARANSQEIKSDFKNRYYDIPIEVTYDAPYFKVTVGKFLTKEEAIMLWGNLLGRYPTAFVVPIDIKADEFASLRHLSLASSSIQIQDGELTTTPTTEEAATEER